MPRSLPIFARYRFLKQLPIFSKLNWLQIQRIARKSKMVEFKKGEFVCKQGSMPDSFYCLVSGRIQSYYQNEDGEKAEVSFIRRGMNFGVTSVLTGDEHTLNCEAINDSVVLKIEKNDFQLIMKSIPHLGVELSHSLSQKIHSRAKVGKQATERSIISVFSPTKDSGKSTYATNLAVHLSRETGEKVVLARIVPSINEAPEYFNSVKASEESGKEKFHLNDIISNNESVKEVIQSTGVGIHYIFTYYTPDDESILDHIGFFVTSLAHDFQHVVIDLPYHMDDVVMKTLSQSDIIHIVTLDGQDELMRTRNVIYKLEETLGAQFDLEKIQVLISGRLAMCYLSFSDVNENLDFDVYMKLPHIEEAQKNLTQILPGVSIALPGQENEYAQGVRKIARLLSGVSVGLVLGGGAALGVAHVGVIKALVEENIPIDMVAGSSMGALIAAFWTTGMDIEGLEKIAGEFGSNKDLMKLCDPVLPISGLVGGRRIKHWLRTRGLRDKIFYSTKIPLKIIAYDLVKRKELVLNSGSIVDAVAKSIAIPGIIVPVQEQDKVIIDGGVLNPLPTNVLTDLGIKKIIAINVLQSPEQVTKGFLDQKREELKQSRIPFLKSPVSYVGYRFNRLIKKLFTPSIPDIIVRSLQASEYVIAEQNAKKADVLIHPDLTGIAWYELYKVEQLLKIGEEAGRKALPEIKMLISKNSKK